MPRFDDRELILLDGAMGTALEASGLALPAPDWSAHAVLHHPQAVRELHLAYARAGAEVLTACTFRTTFRALGEGWEEVAHRAVELAREAAASVDHEVRVAGSIAPLEDCWRPDLSPPDPGPEHRALAGVLADAGVDLLLCETFTHVGEGHSAARAAASTGLPVWLSFSAGPSGDLLDFDDLVDAFDNANLTGADALLLNCVPLAVVEAVYPLLGEFGLPWGVYPNAGAVQEGHAGPPLDPATFARVAQRWVEAGASIVGGCCGTTPAHLEALAARLAGRR
ncbi:MAG: homocysteine S-methyltransferase family protein [Deltaproteobacteria bacterium]|nr:homocysteine S-methyltransferase family protein [Deltaproteobacteria bacterium]